jgi:hypothetical protein
MSNYLKMFYTLTLILFSQPNFGLAQDYYRIGPYGLIHSNTDVPLVYSLNIKGLVDKYFPGSKMETLMDLNWENGKRYSFNNVFFQVGLYPTVREAEDAMLLGLQSGTDLGFSEGPVYGEKIGDNVWYSPSRNQRGEYILGLGFIRYNAVLFIGLKNMDLEGNYLLSLSKNIDQDIINGAPYLKSRKTISPPIINSVDISPKEILLYDTMVFTLDAFDPEGYSFTYHLLLGFHPSEYPDNILILKAIPGIFPFEDALLGPHKLKFWVMNENHLFSSPKELQVTFLSPSWVNSDEAGWNTPQVFTLSQNTPNPFNPTTTISFTLPISGNTTLTIYNAAGQKVRTLISGNQTTGIHSVLWDGKDDFGKLVSSGVYIVRLSMGKYSDIRKMMLVR